MNEVFEVKTRNGFVRWKLTPECEREIGPIADHFGLGLKKFLYLFTLGTLPGQLPTGNPVNEENAPPGFSVSACADPALWARVERVAKHDGRSIEDFVWQAIASSVNCSEEEMVLSPKTGDSISGDCLVQQFIWEVERNEI
jgi:hypothetical protein